MLKVSWQFATLLLLKTKLEPGVCVLPGRYAPLMEAEELNEISEQKVKELGLNGNPNLPVLDRFPESGFKTGTEIAKRILALGYLISISFDVKRKEIKKYLKHYDLYDSLSANEKKLLNKLFLTKQDRVNASWFSESIEVLGWAIGLWDNINPLEFCDEDRQVDLIPIKSDPPLFIDNAKLIDQVKIRQQADLIYRLHWIAKRKGIGKLGKHSNDVYSERHKAINWIIGTANNWDEVSTDT